MDRIYNTIGKRITWRTMRGTASGRVLIVRADNHEEAIVRPCDIVRVYDRA